MNYFNHFPFLPRLLISFSDQVHELLGLVSAGQISTARLRSIVISCLICSVGLKLEYPLKNIRSYHGTKSSRAVALAVMSLVFRNFVMFC